MLVMAKKLFGLSLLLSWVQLLFAQQISNYTFTNPSTTFTFITGGTQPAPTAGDRDDGYYNSIPIGFTFYYLGQPFTTLSASTNGFVVLGQSLTSSFPTNDLDNGSSVTPRPILAPLWDDLRMRVDTNFSYLTTGVFPARVFTAQWRNVLWGRTAPDSVISFQLKLYELDGKIEFIYRSEPGTVTSASASIGISGVSSGSFNRIVPFISINETPAVTTTEFTAFNTKTPLNNRAFTFSVGASPAAPTLGAFTNIGSGYTQVNWTDASNTETYFIIERRTGANPFVEIGRVNSTSRAGTGSSYRFVSVGLSPSTSYDYRVTAVNESSEQSAYATGSQSTTAPTALSGTKTICPSGCDFPSIGAAFSEASVSGLSGATTFELTASYAVASEAFPIRTPYGTASNTVTLRPAAGVTDTFRFVQTAFANTPVFLFDSSSYVNIDGRPGGSGSGRNLAITSFDTATAAVLFRNGSTNNTVRNTTVAGLNNSATSGLIHFSTSTTALTGNNNNFIINNEIKDTSTLYRPINGIFSLGSSGKMNTGNTISDNIIRDYFSATQSCGAIVLSDFNTQWTITQNRVFQTASRTFTGAALQLRGIYISDTNGTGFSVTKNVFGFTSASETGKLTLSGSSNEMRPIYLAVGTSVASRIDGNRIAGISQTSSRSSAVEGENVFIGIRVNSGLVHVGSVEKNTIGNMVDNGLSIASSSIYVTGATFPAVGISISGSSNDSISNNEIGAIFSNGANQGLHGIRCASTGSITIHSNTIGSTVLNSMVGTITADRPAVIGIAVISGVNTIVLNTVQNLTNTGANTRTAGSTGVVGIHNTSTTGGQNITRNNILNLANTNTGSGNYGVIGLYYSGGTTGTNTISRNKIRGLTLLSSGTGAFIFGYSHNAGNATISNNEISIGFDRDGVVLSNPYIIRGINEVAGASLYYFNSVLINGVGVLNNNATFAFFTNVATGTRAIQNNVFSNERGFEDSLTMGTNRNFAIRLAGTLTGGAIAGLTLNHNQYFTSGTGGAAVQLTSTIYQTLANWTAAATSHDGSTVFQNPEYNSFDNLQSGNALSIPNGTAIGAVTIDINGLTRTNNKRGAYETAGDVKGPTIIHTPVTRTTSTGDANLIADITDFTGVPTSGVLRPKTYYRKNSAAWQNATGTLSSGSGTNGTWSFTLSAAAMGTLTIGDTIKYYIVAQDLVGTPNISSNPTGVVATDVNTVTSEPSSVNQTRIVDPLNNSFTIGNAADCGFCDYTSLSGTNGFFAAINGGLLGGNTVVKIEADLTETGAVGLTKDGLGSFSLQIKPSDTATVVKVVSASNLTTAMIRINASRVTIDGRVGGSGHFLRFVNTHSTNTSGQNTFLFDDGASNDTIQNTIIENNTAAAGRGCIALGSTGTISGFVIRRNFIRGAIGTPGTIGNTMNGIVSATANVSSFTIGGASASDSNDFVNFRTAGVNFASSLNNHNISNNNFYFSSGTSTSTTNNASTAISVVNGFGHTISNNSIGGSNKNRTGAAMAVAAAVNQAIQGISVNLSAIDSSFILNNTISNMGQVANGTAKNTIGINIAAGLVRVQGNTIGGGASASDTLRSGAIGAGVNVSGGSVLITNNTIGNITYSGNGAFATNGIRSSAGNVSVVSNTIRNISGFSAQTLVTGTEQVAGVYLVGTITVAREISRNTIFNITNIRDTISSGLVSRVYGIRCDNAGSTMNIFNNTVYGVSAPVPSGGGNMQIVGISVRGTTAQTIYNNNISINPSGGNHEIRGIEIAANNTRNVFYNTIYVGGTAAGSIKSYALFRESTGGTQAFRNNFAYIDRSGGSGDMLAIGLASVSGLSFSNNALVTTDSTKVGELAGVTYNFSGFNTATTHANGRYGIASLYPSSSLFSNRNTAALSHNTCLTNNGATPVSILVDFNNVTRATDVPDIGSFEFSGPGLSWLGVNTNYQSPLNWCGYNTPSAVSSITIPATANNPVLNATTTISSITLNPGTTLALNGQVLTINGDISGTGTLIGSSSSSLVIGGTGNFGSLLISQTTPGTSNVLRALTLNKGGGGSATIGNALIIADSLRLLLGTLNTGGNITLASTNTLTAKLLPINPVNATISGNMSVQRFVPSQGRRFRFLGSPVAATTLTDWKNEIHITGPGTGNTVGTENSNGFDASLSNQSSVFYYDEAASGNLNQGWTSPANKNEALVVGRGYRVFVRGPRTEGNGLLDGSISAQNAVTLDVSGSVNVGDINMPVSYSNTGSPADDGWNLLANPYPCPISWNAFHDAGRSGVFPNFSGTDYTNLAPVAYVFSAASNRYESYNALSDTGTLSGGIIPSGGAFFVVANGAPTMTMKETYKTLSTPIALFKNSSPTLSIRFYSDSSQDDVFLFKPENEASPLLDGYDIPKLTNPGLNISSVGADGKKYTLDARPLLGDQTTIPLFINATDQGAFFFEFNGIDHSLYNLTLVDKFLNKEMPVKNHDKVSFNITADTKSFGGDRFLLRFNASATTAISGPQNAHSGFFVFPNPVTDQLNIRKQTAGIAHLRLDLVDALGKEVFSIPHSFDGMDQYSIDLSALKNGLYFLRMVSEDNTSRIIRVVK